MRSHYAGLWRTQFDPNAGFRGLRRESLLLQLRNGAFLGLGFATMTAKISYISILDYFRDFFYATSAQSSSFMSVLLLCGVFSILVCISDRCSWCGQKVRIKILAIFELSKNPNDCIKFSLKINCNFCYGRY